MQDHFSSILCSCAHRHLWTLFDLLIQEMTRDLWKTTFTGEVWKANVETHAQFEGGRIDIHNKNIEEIFLCFLQNSGFFLLHFLTECIPLINLFAKVLFKKEHLCICIRKSPSDMLISFLQACLTKYVHIHIHIGMHLCTLKYTNTCSGLDGCF